MGALQRITAKYPKIAKALYNPAFGIINVDATPNGGGIGYPQNIPHVESNANRPRNFMLPLQLERLIVDITTLNLSYSESENAWYPHRFRMQQVFIQMMREGHTFSCIEKRKRLTLQKDFCIGKQNADGQWIKNEEATRIFKNKKWFKTLVNYGLDAQFYGYSLIQLGDLVIKGKNYDFKNLTILKRWNVSPDRHQLVQIPYQTWGLSIDKKEFFRAETAKRHDSQYAVAFTEDVDDKGQPFDDWWIYVDTPSDIGASICGYGLLAVVAQYSIILKSNLKWNANLNQMSVAPYRWAQTDEQYDSDDYKRLEQALAGMGNSGYLLTSKDDMLQFITGNIGTTWQAFPDLEKRCQAMISKIIGGHANFMDAQATALGGGSGGKKVADEDTTPEGKAMLMVEKEQDDFCLNFLNDSVYGKLQNLGFPLKDDEQFYLPNDKEEMEVRKREDEANTGTATLAKTMKEAGLKMDATYFEERTGIPTEEVEEPAPIAQAFGNKDKGMKIAAKLKKIYK